jgi:hypothetical protein
MRAMRRQLSHACHAPTARALTRMVPGAEGLQKMQPRDRGDWGAAGRLRAGLTAQVHKRAPQDGTSSALHLARRDVEGAACECQITHKVIFTTQNCKKKKL